MKPEDRESFFESTFRFPLILDKTKVHTSKSIPPKKSLATAEEILVHRKLKNGFVKLSRSTQGGEILLHFQAELNTRHPADLLWEQLVLAQIHPDRRLMLMCSV